MNKNIDIRLDVSFIKNLTKHQNEIYIHSLKGSAQKNILVMYHISY